MDIRDFSMARSYAKDIIVAMIERGTWDEFTDNNVTDMLKTWDALSASSLKWYCDMLRKQQQKKEE